MKRIVPLLLFLIFPFILTGQNTKTIKGKVTDGKNPIANVNISILDKDVSTFTEDDGSYTIIASAGDVLVFNYAGMKTISIQVEDVTRILNPIMVPDVKELDEVVVKGNGRKSQNELAREYVLNKALINTAFGIIDTDGVAGQVYTMNENQINDVSICILNLLRNRFPGVNVFGDCSRGGDIAIRSFGSINNISFAIYDVDGMIFNDPPIWILPADIERIAVLSSRTIATRYGSLGAGGVIVINTKGGITQFTYENGKPYDRAKLRNNFADGKELTKEQLAKNKPVYLKELESTTSFKNAVMLYENFAERYSSSPYFFLDAYRYFYSTWNERDFADQIIEDNYGQFFDNAVLLKALAYTYDAQERFEEANEVYKEIFILRPNYAQSYYDMANSYRDVKELKRAAALYSRYEYLLKEGFMLPDTVSFGPMMEREFNNLLKLEGSTLVDAKKSKKLYVAEEEFGGTRLVFEWNDSEAEFELQFVNPMDQYYEWKHSLASNGDIIANEKLHGYSSSEYLIDDSLPGTWKVNINYLGNKSLTPTYLKTTIYHNYGSKNQRKEILVHKLRLKNKKQELFSVTTNGAVVQ